MKHYVIVEGMRGPRKAHATLEKARAEAERLHAKHEGKRRVHVLAPVHTIEKAATIQAQVEQPVEIQSSAARADVQVVYRKRRMIGAMGSGK